MYEAFYGLKERPFNLTPDPRFLYLSEKHKEAFAHLQYSIQNRTGFVMVSGEVGTGKTTICRSLLNQLDTNTELAFIFNPMLSPKELLKTINEDFGIESHGDTIKQLIDELNAYLLDRTAQGKNCVLVIDEAQNLKPEVLEQVRLLSNLETETQKLLQIVLIGQPELAQNLDLPELRQLNQRITARYHLMPLSRAETLQYIAYRLRVATGRGKVRFTRGAVKLVYKYSEGTPRMINSICDRALLVGYVREKHAITARVVRQAVKEIRGAKVKPAKRKPAPALTPAPMPAPVPVAAPAPRRGPSLVTGVAAVAVLAAAWYGAMALRSPTPHPGVTLPAPTKTVAARAQDIEPVPPMIEEAVRAAEVPGSGAAAEAVPAPPLEPPDPLLVALESIDASEARATAARTVLQAWGVSDVSDAPRGDTADSLVAFGRHYGLTECVIYPTAKQLRAINLPAIVRMATDKQSVWLAVMRVEDDRFILTTRGDDRLAMTLGEFQRFFTTETVVFWKDPTPDAPVLARLMSGDAVQQLQQNLKDLDRYDGPVSGTYDKTTTDAVAALQAETGLRPDGETDREVRMVLYSWWVAGISAPCLEPSARFAKRSAAIEAKANALTQALTDVANQVRTPETATVAEVPAVAAAPEPTPEPEPAAPAVAAAAEPAPEPEPAAPAVAAAAEPTPEPESAVPAVAAAPEPAPEPEPAAPAVAAAPEPTPEPEPEPAVAAAPEPAPEPEPEPAVPAVAAAAEPAPEPEPAVAAAAEPAPEPEPAAPAVAAAAEPTPEPEPAAPSVAAAPEPAPEPELEIYPDARRVRVEELPPPEQVGPRDVTPPAAATSPLVPRESAAGKAAP